MEEPIFAAIHQAIGDDGEEAITRVIDAVLRASADDFSCEEILSLLVSAAIGHVAADPDDAPAPETIAGALLDGMMTGMPEEFVSGKIAVKTRIYGRTAIAVASRRTMPGNPDALRIGLLHHAARIGDAAAIQALAGARSDPNAMDGNGCTPLHYAAVGACTETIAALAEAGADPNARNFDGESALHYAAVGKDPQIVSALVEAGADARARDADGYTPLRCAYATGSRRVIAALLEAGGSANEDGG